MGMGKILEMSDPFEVGIEIPDTTGLPEAYVTRAVFEDAGDGMMRVIRCVTRNRELVPVFSYVTPAASMLRDAVAAIEFAKKIMLEGSNSRSC
jgi:hypothetical protein